MLKLFDAITKSIVRKHLKEQKKGTTNEIASAYVQRLTKGRQLDRVQVMGVFVNRLKQFKTR